MTLIHIVWIPNLPTQNLFHSTSSINLAGNLQFLLIIFYNGMCHSFCISFGWMLLGQASNNAGKTNQFHLVMCEVDNYDTILVSIFEIFWG